MVYWISAIGYAGLGNTAWRQEVLWENFFILVFF
jgi:hypothetical protein